VSQSAVQKSIKTIWPKHKQTKEQNTNTVKRWCNKVNKQTEKKKAASVNSYVLRWSFNDAVESANLRGAGRAFHSFGATASKALSPRVLK